MGDHKGHEHNSEEELLESLWYMQERGDSSLEALRRRFGMAPYTDALAQLTAAGKVSVAKDEVTLLPPGEELARGIVRRHRLAERLLSDALGMAAEETEKGACEFEHVVAPEITDSICTLLGHPRVCPHGMPIPEGECCVEAKKSIEPGVAPVTELPVGSEATVAYLNAAGEMRLKKLMVMGVAPGVKMRLVQTSPAVVLEISDVQVAMEPSVADDIFVWSKK